MARIASSQQRKDLRIPYNENVQFSMDQFNWHLGRSQNISKRGIFVETGKMLKLGSKLYLNFKIPGRHQTKNIKATGEVVRIVDTEEKALKMGSSGIGVSFSLIPTDENVIRSFIRSVADRSVPAFSSPSSQVARPVYGKAGGSLHGLLKWWVKGVAAKAFTFKGFVVEMVALIIIVLIVFKVIL
jgi:Tfp pilus assembly protein PilZ